MRHLKIEADICGNEEKSTVLKNLDSLLRMLSYRDLGNSSALNIPLNRYIKAEFPSYPLFVWFSFKAVFLMAGKAIVLFILWTSMASFTREYQIPINFIDSSYYMWNIQNMRLPANSWQGVEQGWWVYALYPIVFRNFSLGS